MKKTRLTAAARGPLLLIIFLLVVSLTWGLEAYAQADGRSSVALLPIASSASQPDTAWIPPAIFDGLWHNFQQISSIALSSPSSVQEALKAEKLKVAKGINEAKAKALGRRLKADVVVATVYELSKDENVSLRVTLIEPNGDATRESITARESLEDLLEALSSLTLRAASRMNYRVSGEERHAIRNPPTSSFKAYSDYRRALHAYDVTAGTGNLSEAVALLTNAVKRDPHFAAARFQLGLLAARQGQTDQAATHLQRLIEEDARYPNIQYNLGLARLNQGDYTSAQRELQKAYQVNPQQVNLLNDLALANYYMKDYKAAKDHLSSASEQAPESSIVWNNVGTVAYAMGDFEEAQKAFLKAIQYNPKSVSSHYNLGLAFLQLAEVDKAKKAFEKTLELDPRHIKSYYSLALISQNDGTGKAEAYWKKYLELAKTDPAEQPFITFAQHMLSANISDTH